MGKHTDAELRALSAVEASLSVTHKTGPDVELVDHHDALQVHRDFVGLEQRAEEQSRRHKHSRAGRLRRYAWLLWAVPTFLVCVVGAATVIFLLMQA
jgi:hypothetical protein